MNKICSKCGKEKDIEEFSWKNKAKGIRRGTCKSCRSEYDKQWYKDNPNKRREYIKQWRRDNPGKCKEYNRQYREDNPIDRLRSVWGEMNQRCSNPNNKAYKYYGGKGIRICVIWRKYSAFKDWAMNNGYEEHLTIERINVDGDYCPENCTWIPRGDQNKNKRRRKNVREEK